MILYSRLKSNRHYLAWSADKNNKVFLRIIFRKLCRYQTKLLVES